LTAKSKLKLKPGDSTRVCTLEDLAGDLMSYRSGKKARAQQSTQTTLRKHASPKRLLPHGTAIVIVWPTPWTSFCLAQLLVTSTSTSMLKCGSHMVCVLQVDFTKSPILNSRGVDSSVINAEASLPSSLGENNRSAPPGLFDSRTKSSLGYSRRTSNSAGDKGQR
jgi:hypothetical protein